MLGGLFGVVSRGSCVKEVFFGTDYNTHLGTEMGGLAFLNEELEIVSHDISNSQFKTRFGDQLDSFHGELGIGVISDTPEEQPLKFESKVGTFALCTVGLIKNLQQVYYSLIEKGVTFKKSTWHAGANVPSQTELVGELICRGNDVVDGIQKMYEIIDGTISLLLLSERERVIYASGDKFPLVAGAKEQSWAVASETTAFPNLGYRIEKFLDYREIVAIGQNGLVSRIPTHGKRKFCPFLHIYSGFPASDYYGINSEIVRERCGGFLAEHDDAKADLVLGVADSGLPHTVGYVKRKIELTKEVVSNSLSELSSGKISLSDCQSKVDEALALLAPLRRPMVKYTPGWGRSYIPPVQKKRELVAQYKQVPNPQIIQGKSIIMVDDSIRRGTQLRNLIHEKILPFEPKEIHGRIASPPQYLPCIYDLTTRPCDLATYKREEDSNLVDGAVDNSGGDNHDVMCERIRRRIGFTTLRFLTPEEMIKAVIEAPGNKTLKKEDLCLYCWTGCF